MKPRFISFIVLGLFLLASCHSGPRSLSSDLVDNPNSANGKAGNTNLPVISFAETTHDFGKIIQGETVSYIFHFKNTGKSDLIIADVNTSCGCTVPSFPKTPVGPGKDGTIKVTFNSNGKHGYQSKNIIVVANTQPNTTVVHIKAEVTMPGGIK
ncbi:MAG: DUF1573 domain-containing protein [Bacteroidota bacterium]|nr:DUF1573 domain-containing protein [Bacteroidota bacterium]